MKYTLSILVACLLHLQAFAQLTNGSTVCPNNPLDENVAVYGLLSTNVDIASGLLDHLNDGYLTQASIDFNQFDNAWVEIDLQEVKTIASVAVHYDASTALPNQGYYLITSPYPLTTANLSVLLTSGVVEYVHITSSIPSGFPIDLPTEARYVRLQSDGNGLSTNEIIILGGGDVEICGNGIDDDCDDLVDCEDSECGVNIFNVETVTVPSCPLCSDGSLYVQAFGNSLTYSFDGGLTFGPSPVANGLPPGSYTIVVRNGMTGCESEVIIVLEAPPGMPNGCCDNGDFESGDFSNWTGGISNNSNGAVTFNNQTILLDNPATVFDDGRHTIIPQGYYDSAVETLLVGDGSVGSYLVKLGNRATGAQAERLTYCFEVTECNSDFSFNYLVVFQDPGHNPNEQPFFEYTIGDAALTEVIAQERIVSEDSPFFETADGQGSTIRYTYWNCVNVDLSDWVGRTVCAEFVTADCSRTQHFGYAYIDGLCNDPDDSAPQPVLSGFYDNYCLGQDIVIDGSESYGFNQFGWEVCQVFPDGTTDKCVTQPVEATGIIGILDVEAFYEDGGFSFECGNTYRITLTLVNNCGDPVSASRDVKIHCQEGPKIDYFDITNCLGNQVDLQIEGNYECTNCTVTWEPGIYLDDPNAIFPVIEGSRNTDAVYQEYNVVVQDEIGCIEEDVVDVYNIFTYDFEASLEKDSHCKYLFEATISTATPFPRDYAAVTFINTTTGQEISGEITNPPGTNQSTIWNYAIEVPGSTADDGNWIAISSLDVEETASTNCPSEEIALGEIQNSDLFYGPMHFLMPNFFSPNGDGVNEIFRPYTPVPCDDPGSDGVYCEVGHNAISARLRVYNRWGQLVFDETAESAFDAPFDPEDLTWDGTVNGSAAPADVYIYRLDFYNCTYFEEEEDCKDFNDCSAYSIPANYIDASQCNCTLLTGQVTLAR